MIYKLLIIYIFVLSLLSYFFYFLIRINKLKNNLLFFLLSNFILSFSFLVFLFYYKGCLFSLINIFLLLINTIFLSFEIRVTYGKYSILSMPYLLYIMFVIYLIFDLYLMHL